MASAVYPLPHGVKAIGTPYVGTHTVGNWQSDNAVDLPTPEGTPVYAVVDGVIGNRIGSLGSKSSRFAGLRVYVNGGGNEFYYAHLSKLTVKAGQHVRAGQIIGYSGSANGVAHLHFAAKTGDPRAAFGPVKQQDSPAVEASAAPAAEVPADAPQIVPPASSPPPTALGLAGPQVNMPGSVNYTLSPHHEVYGLWQQVADGNEVSQDTTNLLRNAQLSAGV